jgi:hypothetical protein
MSAAHKRIAKRAKPPMVRTCSVSCPLCNSEAQPLALVRSSQVPQAESFEAQCRWCGALLLLTAMVTKGAR